MKEKEKVFFTFKWYHPNLKKLQSSEDDQNKDQTWRGKFMYFMGVMTIEPLMFMQGLSGGICTWPTDQMIVYKTCRGKI